MRKFAVDIRRTLMHLMGLACLLASFAACNSVPKKGDGVSMLVRMEVGQTLCMLVEGEVDSVYGIAEQLELGEYGIYTITDTVIELMGQIRKLDFPMEPILDAPNLVKLDVTRCPHLTRLGTGMSMFTELDLSKCPELEELEVACDALPELDLSACPKLRWLSLWDAQLSKLDLSHAAELETLRCIHCDIDSIDLSGCSRLLTFSMADGELPHVAFQQLPWLDSVFMEGGRYDAVEVRDCQRLRSFVLGYGRAKRIAVEDCPTLKTLYLAGNEIESLKLANCPSLRTVTLHNSNLDDEAMMRVVESLPECPSDGKGKLVASYLRTMRNDTIRWEVSRNVWEKAVSKGWDVYRDEDGVDLTPVKF